MAPDKTLSSIEDATREKIAKYLPNAIATAINSYHEFYDQQTPETAKDFSAHHSACKAAIAHIELLLKLARWADLPGDDGDKVSNGDDLSRVLMTAQAELQKYEDQERAQED